MTPWTAAHLSPPLSPRVCLNSCPLSQWCRPTISSCYPLLLPSIFPASESFLITWLFFPNSSPVKESTCNAGDLGLIPGLGRSPGEGNSYPLRYSGLENSWVTNSWTRLSDFHFTIPSGGQIIGASASASVPPMNIQSWFPLRLTGLLL